MTIAPAEVTDLAEYILEYPHRRSLGDIARFVHCEPRTAYEWLRRVSDAGYIVRSAKTDSRRFRTCDVKYWCEVLQS